MYTDDINDYLCNKYQEDLDIVSLNNKKLMEVNLYENDLSNTKLTLLIKNEDLTGIKELIKEESEIEVLLEMLSRLNTCSFVDDELKDIIYNKYQELLEVADPDLLLDVFTEVLGYSFSSPLNGDIYHLLDLYDRMILSSFKDQDYTKYKAKAIKDLKNAKLSKEVNNYLDKIIKAL